MKRGSDENIFRSTLNNKSYRLVSILAVIGVVAGMALDGLNTTSDWIELIWKSLMWVVLVFIGFVGYKIISSNKNNKSEKLKTSVSKKYDKKTGKNIKSKKGLDKILDKMDDKKTGKNIKSKKGLDKILDKMDNKSKSKKK